jgi:hypothetical protein
MDIGSMRQNFGESLWHYRLERLATAIVAAGRARLPADADAARGLVGGAWAPDGVAYERTARGFRVFVGNPGKVIPKHASVLATSTFVVVELDP